MSTRTHIVLVGGGSGGHFYPLMSIAEALIETGTTPKLYYMGPDPYDKEALSAYGISYVYVPAGKRRKYFSLLNYVDFVKTLFGIFVAVIKLFIIYPDVVMSKGGHTSVPVVLAAAFLNIPIVIHDSDAVPGSANKLAARFARHVLVAYPETMRYFKQEKTVCIGIPIRKELRTPPSANPFERLGVDPSLPLILVLGGSHGAERLNELILDSLDEILQNYTVIHQTGEKHFNVTSGSAERLIPDTELFKRYRPVPFMAPEVLNDALHTATLVISRAGSGTIHEIALHGKPSILVPIPETVSHDQRTNAFTYAKTGGAIVIEEGNFSDGLLKAEIDRIIGDQALYADMSQSARAFARDNAAATAATILTAIGEEHH